MLSVVTGDQRRNQYYILQEHLLFARLDINHQATTMIIIPLSLSGPSQAVTLLGYGALLSRD